MMMLLMHPDFTHFTTSFEDWYSLIAKIRDTVASDDLEPSLCFSICANIQESMGLGYVKPEFYGLLFLRFLFEGADFTNYFCKLVFGFVIPKVAVNKRNLYDI